MGRGFAEENKADGSMPVPSGISDEGRERVQRAKDNPIARTNKKATHGVSIYDIMQKFNIFKRTVHPCGFFYKICFISGILQAVANI